MRAIFAFLPLLIACSGESSDTGDTAEDSVDGSGDSTLPLDGSYASSTAVSSNDCGDQAGLPDLNKITLQDASSRSVNRIKGGCLATPDENQEVICTMHVISFAN